MSQLSKAVDAGGGVAYLSYGTWDLLSVHPVRTTGRRGTLGSEMFDGRCSMPGDFPLKVAIVYCFDTYRGGTHNQVGAVY